MSEPTREEMMQNIAQQFGFPDYETFRREGEKQLGKGMVRQLERKLQQYKSEEEAKTED